MNTRMTYEQAVQIANTERFGEGDNEYLATFLSCEAFESRMDPKRALAFRVAAVIVSRAMRVGK